VLWYIVYHILYIQWSCGLMYRSAAARLLGSRVWIPLFVYSICCVSWR